MVPGEGAGPAPDPDRSDVRAEEQLDQLCVVVDDLVLRLMGEPLNPESGFIWRTIENGRNVDRLEGELNKATAALRVEISGRAHAWELAELAAAFGDYRRVIRRLAWILTVGALGLLLKAILPLLATAAGATG